MIITIVINKSINQLKIEEDRDEAIMLQNSPLILVSSPDLIQRMYCLKAIRAEVGFGSGTETTLICIILAALS